MDTPGGIELRMSRKTIRVITTYVCIVVGVFLFPAALSLAGVLHNQFTPGEQLAIVSVAIASGGASVFACLRSRVVVEPESLVVTRYLSATRRIDRSAVVSRRMHPGGWRSAPYHVLIAHDGREIKLPPYLEKNTYLDKWLATVPLARPRSH